MIKPEQIPDAVIEAARGEWLRSDDGAVNDWRKAIAAAINAWPGAWKSESFFMFQQDLLMLLLPQENNDD